MIILQAAQVALCHGEQQTQGKAGSEGSPLQSMIPPLHRRRTRNHTCHYEARPGSQGYTEVSGAGTELSLVLQRSRGPTAVDTSLVGPFPPYTVLLGFKGATALQPWIQRPCPDLLPQALPGADASGPQMTSCCSRKPLPFTTPRGPETPLSQHLRAAPVVFASGNRSQKSYTTTTPRSGGSAGRPNTSTLPAACPSAGPRSTIITWSWS